MDLCLWWVAVIRLTPAQLTCHQVTSPGQVSHPPPPETRNQSVNTHDSQFYLGLPGRPEAKDERHKFHIPLGARWASLVAQLVKNPPTMQETWVRSPGREAPLEKGMATHSSILDWRIPWVSPLGCKKSETTEHLSLFHCGQGRGRASIRLGEVPSRVWGSGTCSGRICVDSLIARLKLLCVRRNVTEGSVNGLEETESLV